MSSRHAEARSDTWRDAVLVYLFVRDSYVRLGRFAPVQHFVLACSRRGLSFPVFLLVSLAGSFVLFLSFALIREGNTLW